MKRKSKGAKRSSTGSEPACRSNGTSKTDEIDFSPLDQPGFEWKISFAQPKPSKKRKRDEEPEPTPPLSQRNPFDERLDHFYQVERSDMWESMTRYRKFTLQAETFEVNDHILVMNGASTDESKSAPICESLGGDYMVAKVLEVRASDEQHVYLRLYFFYRPEELPGGRQPYHATKELIASNYMQIVDAMTVNGKASVKHWDENDDNDEPVTAPEQVFWRQTFDFRDQKLSELRRHCICDEYYNSDRLLINCSNPVCKKWLHADCIAQDAVKRTYESHGIVLPPAPNETPKPQRGRKKRKSGAAGARPNSAMEDAPHGLFSAEIKAADGKDEKNVVEIMDWQKGEEKPQKWDEPVICLFCKEKIV